MTRKKQEKVEEQVNIGIKKVKGSGIINRGLDIIAEKMRPPPIKQVMSNLGKTGSVTTTDFFTETLVDKQLEATMENLEDLEEEDYQGGEE